MKVKKFIANIKEYLGVDELGIKSKRKSVIVLLEKLEFRHQALHKERGKLQGEQALDEELDIIALHIKKAEDILIKLNEKKAKKDKEKI